MILDIHLMKSLAAPDRHMPIESFINLGTVQTLDGRGLADDWGDNRRFELGLTMVLLVGIFGRL